MCNSLVSFGVGGTWFSVDKSSLAGKEWRSGVVQLSHGDVEGGVDGDVAEGGVGVDDRPSCQSAQGCKPTIHVCPKSCPK